MTNRWGLLPEWVQRALVDTSTCMPVAGLDERTATSIMFALEQSQGSGDADTQLALQWLAALQCCQALSDRLLQDMGQVEQALGFWHDQLAAGGHSLFMLLGLGPLTFFKGVTRMVTPHARSLSLSLSPTLSAWSHTLPPTLKKHLPAKAATVLQEAAATASNRLQRFLSSLDLLARTASSTHRQQLASGGVAGAGATLSSGSGSALGFQSAFHTAGYAAAAAASTGGVQGGEGEQAGLQGGSAAAAAASDAHPAAAPKGELSATDKMQQRVLMLQAIRASLAEAIARVHAAARTLHLDSGLHTQACVALSMPQRRPSPFGHAAATATSGGAAGGGHGFAASGLSGATNGAGAGGAPAVGTPAADVAVDDAARGLLAAAHEATRAVVSELTNILTDLNHQQNLITGKATDADDEAPANRAVLQLAAVNRALTGSPSLTRSLTLTGQYGGGRAGGTTGGTGGTPSRGSMDRPFNLTPTRVSSGHMPGLTLTPPIGAGAGTGHGAAAAAAVVAVVGASTGSSGAGTAAAQAPPIGRSGSSNAVGSSSADAVGAGSGSGSGSGAAEAAAGSSSSLARHHHQRESYPDRAVLQRLASMGFQSRVARTGLELQGLGAQLDVRLVITPPHHPSLHLHHHHRPTVKSALDQAKVSAAVAGPLVHLPHWVRRPSRLQRHWLRFTAAALLAVWVGRWLYRHSSLSGSDDLARWTREAVQVVADSAQVHVLAPLLAVRDELTHTFRSRPSIVSPAEFEADKASLLRMLEDFRADSGHDTNSSSSTFSLPSLGLSGDAGEGGTAAVQPVTTSMSAEQQDALSVGMKEVMAAYEKEMRAPVRNLVMGQLVRSLLIQVQRLKLDTEAAMLEMDQILRANELSLSLMAAVPSLLIGWGVLAALYRWLLPAAPDAKRAAVPCRMAMAALERALADEADAAEAAAAAQAQTQVPQLLGAPVGMHQGSPEPHPHPDPLAADPLHPTGPVAQGLPIVTAARAVAALPPLLSPPLSQPGGAGDGCNSNRAELEGLTIFHVYRVYRECSALFRAHDKASRYSEWPSLSCDLTALAAASSAHQRMAVHQRMMRNYKLFQR
uniref:Uncharacterized protein n=1 Tax=Chlamydomonas leiostraca TaxID=1034604 RepID=A0A7S0RH57_9CHLO|mmetsp:Transcript_22666/g.57734  ORF Transcript_22666/g.57734 Transcript_22666/m.57734 type:complete len:1079 (+) Transcript_22666:89-3325(+)|eukprot:CAMPEP_0202858760 /NCGR_PEP_ID=MMETSP1391-20130828/1150_1 /ASSEMBLY_ACC=CAM_ASM_000867 /TAXON_ID=1034604 /ORGANISM="Chlamydomonas leiostraca, Strain SAG 11-49" /LENGTH=1078 /DNA_ID=CAMNT_0049537713 /DNA_START=84 /DNA_END=3320 /DNA_ORIENTATION=+